VVPIARGDEAVLRARVEASLNALEIDDEAFAWIERSRPLRVTVVGDDTAWLTSLFEGDRGVHASFVAPPEYPGGAGRSDVIIFDRWSPQEPPVRPALYLAPPANRNIATEEHRPRWESTARHPVVRGVDPFTLNIERARAYTSPDLVPVARSARGTPLVYITESPERRLVVVTFGPGESNLASAPAFPVLIGNAIDWLAIPGSYRTRPPGLVSFDHGVSTVTGPRGVPVPLVRMGGAAIGLLRSPGLYVAEGGGSRSTIAVNAGDPQVADLTRTTPGAAGRADAVTPGASGRPWWIYCAMAAFALALAEWWTWQRRITI
jgi:hypothetical protein